MISLLKSYSVAEIITFIVVLALGTKGCITFWDWSAERLRKFFHKETQQDLERQKIDALATQQEQLTKDIKDLANKIDMLIKSDKDDIKAYITEKHHFFCYEKKWIDDHSLDCLERRNKHYKDEGGNSFIDGLMAEIRALPKQPPHN